MGYDNLQLHEQNNNIPIISCKLQTLICFKKDMDVQGVYKGMVRIPKLARNLFLTLHGQNVHRQQRQVSKFLMRYQQFDSHA